MAMIPKQTAVKPGVNGSLSHVSDIAGASRTGLSGDGRSPYWRRVAATARGIAARADHGEGSSRDVLDLCLAVQATGIALDGGSSDFPDASNSASRLRKPMTARERQVLAAIAEGKTNAVIGQELFLSEDTIKTHARRMYRKLGARDRAHAVAIALRSGLLT